MVSKESLIFLGYDPSMDREKISREVMDKEQANGNRNGVRVRYPELPDSRRPPREEETSF